MNRQLTLSLAATACLTLVGATGRAADPWADIVVEYVQGTGVPADSVTSLPFNDPTTALGEPTRIASLDYYPSPVSPASSSWRSYETVSIGGGGRLIVKFNEPVTDDPANPYGIDLLVFGNSFLQGNFFGDPNATSGPVVGEGGEVSVSADGVNFVAVFGAADGLYPTNGYADLTDVLASGPGLVPADFTKPVYPLFNPVGKTFAQIIAGYDGSGGGLGVDLAGTGLSSISYVQVRNRNATPATPEIDAFADVRAVPEPGAGALTALALILLGKTARARTL